MTFSEFFVKRPVFSTVLSIIIVLLGYIARDRLAVLKYPKIEVPTITVESNYPGASPDVVETNVTKILEDSFATIQGVDFMRSSSDVGLSNISITFNSNVNIDNAANDVRDRIFRVQSNLPRDMATPTVKKTSMDDKSICILVFQSDKYNVDELRDYIERFAQNKLEVINGVAMVRVVGGGEYAMHIRLNPQKLAMYNLTPYEVHMAIHAQSLQSPGGLISSDNKEFSVVTKGELSNEVQFNDMVLTNMHGKLVRLKDVGYAKKSSKDKTSSSLYNGKEVVAVEIYKQSVSNPIEVVRGVKKELGKIMSFMPKGIKVEFARDDAEYIEKSINRVYRTILESILLVIGIVLLFLWSFKSSIIPLVTIPVSILGTFMLLYVFNCSVNTITLLALVLAIGLVVDDAIVILENVYKYLERGFDSVTAAIKGTNEITFAVIAMTLTLAAVYAPIGLSSGQIGKYFTEFAIALSGAVIISGFVALTLSPMMCAKFLSKVNPNVAGAEKHRQILAKIDEWYKKSLDFVFKHRLIVSGAGLLIAAIGIALAFYKIPSKTFPNEDDGFVFFRAFGPTSSSFKYMEKNAEEMDKILSTIDIAKFRHLNITNRKIDGIVSLVDWSQRNRSCFDVSKEVKEKLSYLTGIYLNINTGESDSKGDVVSCVLQTNVGMSYLRKQAKLFNYILYKYGTTFSGIESTPLETAQELSVYIDRARAASLCVNVQDIADTIEILFRGRIPTRIKNKGKMYDVFIKLDEAMRTKTQDISDIYVKGKDFYSTNEYGYRTNEEKMIKLSDLVEIKKTNAPITLHHYDQLLSMDFRIGVKDGYSIIDSVREIQTLKNNYLPDDISVTFSGATKTYMEDRNKMVFIFAMALIFIFLVLAAQFESFIDPFIILLSVPLAISGALIVLLFVKDGSLNVYSQIGLVTLIGLITKHGILIVDFANKLREKGKQTIEAVKEAAALRLRPILMTTFAMVIGVVPLAFATGAGAEGRIQIGWVILGGMLLGTAFTLFFVPVMYSFLSRSSAHVKISNNK